jgi:CRISPR-associated protein Csd2
MEVCKLYWWQHNCRDGQYSSAKVHRSLSVKVKDGVQYPTTFNDYEISLENLPNLTPEVFDGV